ncbi:hypothetical protein [Clostridium paraputrificum]|uniref:hypothetical protein n=1 Tax=Clostridium paraputrificum TaxID=29363 RepID=UPI0018A0083C|nr:hypothetical protein [Clostridium paraputrificum]
MFKIVEQKNWNTNKCSFCNNEFDEQSIKDLVFIGKGINHTFKTCKECLKELSDVIDKEIK